MRRYLIILACSAGLFAAAPATVAGTLQQQAAVSQYDVACVQLSH